jgi:hypothetical protein
MAPRAGKRRDDNAKERGICGLDKETIFAARRNFSTPMQLSKNCDERRVRAVPNCDALAAKCDFKKCTDANAGPQ